MATINGQSIEGTPKVATVVVNKKELKLTLVYVSETEVEAQWTWVPFKGVTAESVKVGNRVSTMLKVGDKIVFTNLSARAVFEVIEAKYGQSASKTDSLYKTSNPTRKESKKGTAAPVKVDKGTW